MLYIRHPSSLKHVPGEMSPSHPDAPARIAAIEAAMERLGWLGCELRDAPAATEHELELVHAAEHIWCGRSSEGRPAEPSVSPGPRAITPSADAPKASACSTTSRSPPSWQSARWASKGSSSLEAPIGAVLEGGYDPSVLAECVPATIAALDGDSRAESIAPDGLVTSRVAAQVGQFWAL